MFRTIIVPKETVVATRALANLFGPSAQGMWETGLSDTEGGKITHYISTGIISKEFARMLPLTDPETNTTVVPDPNDFIQFALSRGIAESLLPSPEEIQTIAESIICTTEQPFICIERLGLFISAEENVFEETIDV